MEYDFEYMGLIALLILCLMLLASIIMAVIPSLSSIAGCVFSFSAGAFIIVGTIYVVALLINYIRD